MSKPQLGWRLIVKDKAGNFVTVKRNLPEEEAQRRGDRAKKRGFQVEVKPEPRNHSRRNERYVNSHPKARRRAA